MTEGIDPACKLCGESETTDHIFACHGRKKWRHNLYKTLCKWMERKRTAPAIIKAVLHGLRWHYEADYQPQTQIEDEHQHDIGWNHLLRGWVDRSWQSWQEAHIRKYFPEDKKAAQQAKLWTLQFIELMWEEAHKLWKDRCDSTHEKLGRDDTSRRRERIVIKVTAIYERSAELNQMDRDRILKGSLADKLQETTRQLERWHSSVTPAFKQALHDSQKRMKASTHDIRDFFGAKEMAHTEIPATIAVRKKNRKRQRPGRLQPIPMEAEEGEEESEVEIPTQMYQQQIKFTTNTIHMGLYTNPRRARIPPALQRQAKEVKKKRTSQRKITHSMASTTAITDHPT